MKLRVMGLAALLIIALAASLGAFSMPSLLGRSIVPQMMQQAAPQLPSQALTPADIEAQTAAETFTLSLSGNIYYDKLPVQGAEVTVYLNGRKMGQTTAGDLYQFQVPGVKIGDTVRVDASYEGHSGTATEVVKFKSMSLNVNIDSGRSFIRSALEMLPTKDDIAKSQQQEQQPAQQQTQQQQASQPAGSSTTTSSADASQLTGQIFGDATKQLTNTIGQTNNALANPAALTSAADSGGSMNFNDISDAMKASGFSGLP